MGKQEAVLPKIAARNPILNKSVWVGIFATFVALFFAGAINLTSLTANQIMSGGFFATLFTVFVLAEVVDMLAGNGLSRYVLQNALGSVLVALFLGTVLQLVGVTAIAMNMASGLAVLVGTTLLFYIGALIERKFLH